VPVFGCDLEGEGELEEGVDGGDGGAAVGDCEGAVLLEGEGVSGLLFVMGI
jgi:hypothetical protein